MIKKWKDKWNLASARKRAIAIGSVLGCLFGSFLIAFAISQHQDSDSFVIGDKKGSVFSVDLSGEVEGIDMVPGTQQSVSPSVQNTGTIEMYVFVRFDVSTTNSGGPVYSFMPSIDGWTQDEAKKDEHRMKRKQDENR